MNDDTKDGNEVQELPEAKRLLNIPIPHYTCLYGKDDVKPILQRKRRRRKHQFNPTNFVLPKDFIQASSCMWHVSSIFSHFAVNAMDIGEEYDITSDDEKWLRKVNTNRVLPITDASFERIFAIANRMGSPNAGYVSAMTVQQINQRILKQALLFRPQPADILQQQAQKEMPPIFEVFPSSQPTKTVLVSQPIQEFEVQPVLDYWTTKYQHKFKHLVSEEDALFQAEQKLRQLQVLRQEFEKARLLLELVMKREKTKKKWVEAQRVELNLLYKYKKSGKSIAAFLKQPVEDAMEIDDNNEIESNTNVRSPAAPALEDDESTMEDEDEEEYQEPQLEEEEETVPKKVRVLTRHQATTKRTPRKLRRAKKRRFVLFDCFIKDSLVGEPPSVQNFDTRMATTEQVEDDDEIGIQHRTPIRPRRKRRRIDEPQQVVLHLTDSSAGKASKHDSVFHWLKHIMQLN